MGIGKVGLLGKALKLQTLWKRIAAPIKVYEEVKQDADGTAIYIFQARFPTIEDAKMFKELQQLSADLENEVNGKA
ncbi:MAG: hypothetical protein QXJ74_05235 [Nitrososphaera sp.]